MVRNMMEEPEIQEKIGDEKSVLAKLYRDKARRVVESIKESLHKSATRAIFE